MMKEAEEWTARQSRALVSGSAIECSEARALGCSNVHYIPVSYEAPELNLQKENHPPRVVHLGGMGTTANRLGLEQFLLTVWPKLRALEVPLHVIGSLDGASPSLAEMLAHTVCHGFVENLSDVLRPFDLFVIPWEHSTGQRTKLPMAFAHAQVVVSTEAAIRGFPEVIDGVNCVLVKDLCDMRWVIHSLLLDANRRIELGLAARTTFERCFTRSSLLPRYEALLHSATN